MTRPIVLVVLDGFGIGDSGPADATEVAHTPFFDHITASYPMAKLETSGEAVGLPPGQMGNSEVGHMTMGAGRIIDQELTRISKSIARGDFNHNETLIQAIESCQVAGGRIHIMGLLSDGGVHSHQDHLTALLEFLHSRNLAPVVHAFLDGRDTPPQSGLGYMEALLPTLQSCGAILGTVSGRFYAMDRDQRWERINQALQALVHGEGQRAANGPEAIQQAYDREETDEFVQPTVIDGSPSIADNDLVLFFNFRADRARELTNALTRSVPSLLGEEISGQPAPRLSGFLCFTEYDAKFGLPVLFPNTRAEKILGELVAAAGMEQLRIAETEKYAHVTFFFNSGLEIPFPGEERILVPSPRDVATYDHKPEMSAQGVTRELIQQIQQEDHHFILVNYANPDMVGHTGILPAATKAVEMVDHCLEQVARVVLDKGGMLLITADHGNCELMVDPETGGPHTAHTTNPVPIWWIGKDLGEKTLRDGGLADLAPTLLELLELDIPSEMTGKTLIC